jgi:hypothetical protein
MSEHTESTMPAMFKMLDALRAEVARLEAKHPGLSYCRSRKQGWQAQVVTFPDDSQRIEPLSPWFDTPQELLAWMRTK